MGKVKVKGKASGVFIPKQKKEVTKDGKRE